MNADKKNILNKHATVMRDGYTVPLIGVPPDAVLETCDLCGKYAGLAEVVFTGKQVLCAGCAPVSKES